MTSIYDLTDSYWGLQQPTYWQIQNGSRQYLYKMGISYAEQKAKYPNYFAVLEGKGWTQDRIMGLTQFTVVYNEAAHLNPYNRSSIKIPAGWWAVNAPLKAPQGIIQGVGNGGNAGEGAWGTTLALEGVKWMGDPAKRFIFESWNRYEGKYEWSHSTKIMHMSLHGEMKTQRDPSYVSAGVLIENPGETCYVEDVYCTGFNDFGVFIDGGGAPCTIHNSSYFYNHRAGIGIGSAAISVVRIIEPSGDLNPYLIETFVGTDGSPAGGCITIIAPKSEPNPNPNGHDRPGRGQMLAKFSGYYRVHILGGQSWGHNGMWIDSAIRCESENPSGGLFDNYVRWDGLHTTNHEHLLHDVSNNKKFKAGADFTGGIHDFVWTSKAGGRAVTTFMPNADHNATTLMADIPHIVATYKGRQPWINYADKQAGKKWDQINGGTTGGTVNPITNIVMTPSSVQVNKGQTVNLTATVQGSGAIDGTVVWNVITGGGTLNTTTGNNVVFTAPTYEVTNDAFTQIRAVSNGNPDVMATVDITIKSDAVSNAVTSISATSNKVNVDERSTATLTATVTGTGTFNNGVTWSIVSGGGSLSNPTANPVTYTAPSVSVDSPVVIRATSIGDPTKTANVNMTVKNIDTPAATVTGVTVTSSATQINEGTTANLTAIVTGTGAFNQNVTWSIVNGGGTLSNTTSNNTIYTAPQVAADSTAVIRATAVGDTMKMADTTLTIKNVVTPSTITSVTGTANPTSLQGGQVSSISAVVTGTGPFNTGVTWSIVSGGGTIANTAANSTTYTAPSVNVSTPVQLKATANGDATKSVTLSLNILPSSNTGLTELSRTGWVASASHTNAGGREFPSYAIDADATNNWTSGQAQWTGQWFQVDMGSVQQFSRVVLETTSNTINDYPRGYQVVVSNDGTTWGTPIAAENNITLVVTTGQPTVLTINFPQVSARYIRVIQTYWTNSWWWTMGQFRVFRAGGAQATITGVSATAAPATISGGQTSSVTATVTGTGTFNNAVTWTVVSGGGTITNSNPATYTAPAVTTNTTAVVRATSVGDPTKTANVSITVQPTVAPPPTGNGIDPNKVLIVINQDDPNSLTIANQYATAWGIPAANRVTVSLGNADSVDDAKFNTARNLVVAASTPTHQYYALCFGTPSRVGVSTPSNSMQAITSAMSFGRRNVASLTLNPFLNYNGLNPFTDKGARQSWIVLKPTYIHRSAHGTRPNGTMYGWAAKDQSGSPRGSARISQLSAMDSRPNFDFVDMRSMPDGEVGMGENPYQTPQNWAFTRMAQWYNQYNGTGTFPKGDPRGTLFTKKPMAAAFLHMYKFTNLNEMERQPGWYADSVTSFAGYVLADAGQTQVTYMLDLGASMATGVVSEPWQSVAGNSSGSLAEQFVDVSKFVPMWQDQKLPNATAVWGSVKSIDRLLVAGDGMCAPFI